MVEYCRHCGKQRTGPVCHYCGHNYEPKKIDEVKQEMKRHLKKTRMHVPPLLALIIFAIIFALVILIGIILISPSTMNKGSISSDIIQNNQNQASSSQTNNINVNKISETPSPKLRVFHQMVNQLGGELECFGRVDGGVTNSGSASAYNVLVICAAEEYSIQKDLGTIKASETKTFQTIINYDCAYQRDEECSVTCSNC